MLAARRRRCCGSPLTADTRVSSERRCRPSHLPMPDHPWRVPDRRWRAGQQPVLKRPCRVGPRHHAEAGTLLQGISRVILHREVHRETPRRGVLQQRRTRREGRRGGGHPSLRGGGHPSLRGGGHPSLVVVVEEKGCLQRKHRCVQLRVVCSCRSVLTSRTRRQ